MRLFYARLVRPGSRRPGEYDHGIGLTLYKPEDIMTGNLDFLLNPLAQVQARLLWGIDISAKALSIAKARRCFGF